MKQNSILATRAPLSIDDINLLHKGTKWLIFWAILFFLLLPCAILYTTISDYISYSSIYGSFFSFLGSHKLEIGMFFFMLLAPAVPIYYMLGIIKDIKANSKVIFRGKFTQMKYNSGYRSVSKIIVLNDEFDFLFSNGIAINRKYSDKIEVGDEVAIHYLPRCKRIFYIKKI